MSASISYSGTIPEFYDRFLGPYIFEPFAIEMAARARTIGPLQVLEIACGTGRVTGHLRKALPEAELFATDLIPDMLAIARERIRDEKIRWQTADAQELPFQDAQFDMVLCQFGLMFVPDQPKAMQEAYRVLRAGGRLLFSTWDSLENNPSFFLANEVVAGFFPEEPPRFFHLPFSLFDEKKLLALAVDAGFGDVTVKQVSRKCESASAADTARGMIEGSPIHTYIVGRDKSLLPKIQLELAASLAGRFGSKPLTSPMRAFFVEAVREK
jgi:SAM-dependent methyltransferase